MRLYQLKIHIDLMDVGEQTEDAAAKDESTKDESTKDGAAKHPLLADRLDRAESLMKKAEAMFDLPGKSMAAGMGTGTGHVIHICENYDVPTENFNDVLEVIKKFHDLGNQVGMPSRGPVSIPFPIQ